MRGFGTEKIEEEIPLIFDGISVGRLDTDTARSSQRVLGDFAGGRTQVLVGTQMITKGLDFDRLTLVGILDADSMLHFPDFRAFERTFQLIHQVGGRAGRRKKRGKVVIQTQDPAHPVIQAIREGNYEELYRGQMEERELFGYPPFRRLIHVDFRHKVPSILDGAAAQAATELKQIFAHRVLGPQYPPVRKVHGQFIKHIVLKIEKDASYEKAKQFLAEVLERVRAKEVYRSVRLTVDVDPH
jgi:primosomal protein N' (replication factor Y)